MQLSMKHFSLFVLFIQTTAVVLITRHSRTIEVAGPRYLASTTVFMSEIVKFITCIGVIFVQKGCNFKGLWDVLRVEFFYKPDEAAKLLIPSGLYTFQNNLVFLALSNLDAATYQVTYQLKILTTALFSVLMLGKQLSLTKWMSLLVLMAGIALVQMPLKISESEIEREERNNLVGLLAVLTSCFSSGFAGVYFEKILKGSSQSLWIRNLQMSMIGIGSGLIAAFIADVHLIHEHGFFQGYSSLVWIVITLQALGGIAVAVVMKYADNILKGFANAISIVLSALLSPYILGESSPSRYFYLGSSAVIGATVIYGMDPKLPRRTR